MSLFPQAFQIVVGVEAGYVNDPQDPGGETKYGISKRSYPNVDIPNLTLDAARLIYANDFWAKHNCDKLEWGKALLVFDTAVNGGNADRWYDMFSGLPMKQFAMRYQAEHILYLAGLRNWLHDGRGWMARMFTIYNAAISPPPGG